MTHSQSKQSPTVLLIDNGSSRAQATLGLRRIAKALSERSKQTVHPVSLNHAQRITQEQVHTVLSGKPAEVFMPFMQAQLSARQRRFMFLPLFFGNSNAISQFVPEQMANLAQDYPDIDYQIAPVLYPLPNGEPRLIDILYQHAHKLSDGSFENLVLVDHGSPKPAVSAVRQHIATQLNAKLPANLSLAQAAMERRQGKDYDFNGELLSDYLERQAAAGARGANILLLFLLPGTHAGTGGDIEKICAAVHTKYPQFEINISPLIGDHPLLVECLASRLAKL